MSEQTLEAPQTKASDQPKPRFDPNKASTNGRLGGQARVQQILRDKQELIQLREQMELARPIIQAALAQASALTHAPEENYRVSELIRTRKGLDSLWSDFSSTNDPKERKFLSDAIARLSDVEFALAKRPKPGAFRPVREKQSKQGQAQGPIED